MTGIVKKEVYTKSFEDELDWNIIEQLHRVVLQTGNFCFRTKQIAITIDIAIIGIFLRFTENQLDYAIFLTGLLIPICFWFLDSVGYFYQVKIRGVMDEIRERLKERNAVRIVTDRIIEKERVESPFKILYAFFNHSMWVYYFLIVADLALWAMFHKGAI